MAFQNPHEDVAELFADFTPGFDDADWSRFCFGNITRAPRCRKRRVRHASVRRAPIAYRLVSRASEMQHPWAQSWTRNAPALQ